MVTDHGNFIGQGEGQGLARPFSSTRPEISCLAPAQKSSRLAVSVSNIYNKNGVMRLPGVESGLLPKPYAPGCGASRTRVPGTITQAPQAGQCPRAEWGELPHPGRGAARTSPTASRVPGSQAVYRADLGAGPWLKRQRTFLNP